MSTVDLEYNGLRFKLKVKFRDDDEDACTKCAFRSPGNVLCHAAPPCTGTAGMYSKIIEVDKV